MSKYRVHECDWCKARAEALVYDDLDAKSWLTPDAWREVDDTGVSKTLLCPSCQAQRGRALNDARIARFSVEHPPPKDPPP